MNKQAKIHKSMTNDGVGDKPDVKETEVWTEPAICRLTCDKRKEKVGADAPCETANYSYSQIIELRSLQPTGGAPFLHEEHEPYTPRENEIERKDPIKRPRLAGNPIGANFDVVDNEIGHQ